MTSHLYVVAAGAIVILVTYVFGWRGLYRFVGRFGFVLSLSMLLILVFRLDLGFAKAGSINEAWRVIIVLGKQLHVYEFVKLLMILYVSWALETYKERGFKLSKRLAGLSPKLSFLGTVVAEKWIYLYIPLIVTLGLVMFGSNSSALFLAAILVLLFIVAGLDVKDIGVLGLALILAGGVLVGANKLGIVELNRLDLAYKRFTANEEMWMDSLIYYRPKGGHYDATQFQKYKDKLQQPVGAKLAIKDGGLLGKGIGNSSQKYVVPVIFGDYMFCFIIEETGLVGAIIIILLYYSLLARGTFIAKNCKAYFDKVVVTGFSILITAQAFMHMMVNVHFPLIPQTGQTLPLMSHGTTSFLVFSTVLGVLLSMSKQPQTVESPMNTTVETS